MGDGSVAMGATAWQTMTSISIPAAFSGISAAVILGQGRAIGETMAVAAIMASGTQFADPLFDIFDANATLTSLIATQYGSASERPSTCCSSPAVMLFVIVAGMSIVSQYIDRRSAETEAATLSDAYATTDRLVSADSNSYDRGLDTAIALSVVGFTLGLITLVNWSRPVPVAVPSPRRSGRYLLSSSARSITGLASYTNVVPVTSQRVRGIGLGLVVSTLALTALAAVLPVTMATLPEPCCWPKRWRSLPPVSPPDSNSWTRNRT